MPIWDMQLLSTMWVKDTSMVGSCFSYSLVQLHNDFPGKGIEKDQEKAMEWFK
jgi:hypothetical protein